LINREEPPPGCQKPLPFISHRGNSVILGHCKSGHNTFVNEYQKNEFLWHNDGPTPQPANRGTLSAPKDIYRHSRRPEEAMVNHRAAENASYSEKVEKRKELSATIRTQDMVDRSQRTGYNLITGDIYGDGPAPQRLLSRHIPDGLGPESHNRGMQQLKDSCNRYFVPQESGESHKRRQERLIKEGIALPKMQGVVAIGKPEAPSFGIEDQFSKSKYLNTDITGLVEVRQAGKYTPRKCPVNNPSANPQIRSKWTTGVVISTEYD